MMAKAHRKQLKRFERALHLHELTFSCFQRKPLLTTDRCRVILSSALNLACAQEQFQLIAFVFMPEHVHLLVLPQNDQAKISRFPARFKQPVSRQIRQILENQDETRLHELMVQERPSKRCFRFSQEGAGFDRNMFSPTAISSSIDYIHTNPVKRGLCKRAMDFKWSSARFYLQNFVDPDLPKLIRPDPEWFHQSDVLTQVTLPRN